MVSALGINVQLVFAGAFLIGALLAGLGGVLGRTMIALAPGEDTSFLLNSLIVVIIGGHGLARRRRHRRAGARPRRRLRRRLSPSSATPT
jgi:ribose/xylose/arabinose/galactoside ABC-type transport system permease subunit